MRTKKLQLTRMTRLTITTVLTDKQVAVARGASIICVNRTS